MTKLPEPNACYRCQMGDPHEVHETAEEVYGLGYERRADPLAICPYCLAPAAGPLAGCDKPECTRREIEIEAAFKRLEDE